VVVLTEEPPVTVAEKLTRFGIARDAPLSILTRADVHNCLAWEGVVAGAVDEAKRIGAELIVIDTLAFWAGLPADAENSAGAMTEALRPLLLATGRGLSVLCLHHVAKATGELRGSTAIGAAADIIVTLSREAEAPNRRRLEVLGRFADCPAEPLLVELCGDRYEALGSPRDVAVEERERTVLAVLPDDAPGMTQQEVVEATGLPQQRVTEALRALLAQGAITRDGQGTKGAPYRYWRLRVPTGPNPGPTKPGPEFDSTAEPALYTGRTVESVESPPTPPAGLGRAVLATAAARRWPQYVAAGVRTVAGEAGWQGFVRTATEEALRDALAALQRTTTTEPEPEPEPVLEPKFDSTAEPALSTGRTVESPPTDGVDEADDSDRCVVPGCDRMIDAFAWDGSGYCEPHLPLPHLPHRPTVAIPSHDTGLRAAVRRR
jgi:DNA-binding transcriptional ArsR family regulator